MVGTTVSHYSILEKLGEGGMGEVYLAQDSHLERKVALKFLPKHFIADSKINDRFQREAKAAAALNHPNIITVYDVGEHDGRAFIAMEYLEGQSLRELLDATDGQPLPIEKVIDMMTQMGEGMKKAHQFNIVHRDLKPENLMITADGTVKILDFGLAHELGKTQMSSDHSTMGTLFYMSPEHCDGQKIDHRTDIWAAGVLFYELITGKLPFDGAYNSAVMYSIMAEEPEPLARYKTGVSLDMQKIVDKALAKDREARYQHMDELLVDIQNLQKKSSVGHKGTGTKFERRGKSGLVRGSAVALLLIIFSSLVFAWFYSGFFGDGATGETSLHRIAVLPFDNLNQEEQYQYFADGMTDELIATLSRLDNLRVIARASVVPYKAQQKNLKEISKALNVTVLLDGSVRISGEQLRVSVQLIDAATEENIWSEIYDRTLEDIFAIQGDIAQTVTDTLQIQLVSSERQMMRRSGTENVDAYHLYLKGRYCWNQRTPDCLQLSIDYFEQAIAQDSLFVQPYTGLADAYALLGSAEYGAMPPKQVMEIARSYALKAVELDSTLAEAYTSLANITLFYDWDWTAAERYFQKALALNQNNETAHHWYAIFLILTGRESEAFQQMNLALLQSPLSMIINTDSGWFHHFVGDYHKARQVLEQTLQMDPHFAQANFALGLTYLQLGQTKEAMDQFEKANLYLGEHPLSIAMLGYAEAISGEPHTAREKLIKLEKLAVNRYVPPLYFVLLHMGLNDLEQAMIYLNLAYEERCGYLVYLKADPKFDPLRSHPDFLTLQRKMNL